jgi:serine/threonine protein kinase
MNTPAQRGAPPDSPSLADLVEEIAARAQAGERVDLEAYLRDHPGHADRLRGLLPAVGVLARLALSATTNGGPSVEAQGPAPPVLGDFRIVREVGRGGMGVVYEAEQVSLGRRVALKVLSLAATLDPRFLQRFHNEAQAAARLQHPNIVPVHAVGCEQGVPYYAMQFIEGPTLAHVIDDLRRGVTAARSGDTAPAAADLTSHSIRSREFFRAAARLAIQAAQAVHHSHQEGIVHRDIKPANLLLDSAGRLWVADFGLARVQTNSALTHTGDVVGTLRYMSPEQALGRAGAVDHRADIYGLGVTLYELLTLCPARSGDDRERLLRQVVSEAPTSPRRRNPALPVDLETIVLKAMVQEPEARYASAQELADDLERFLDTRPILARRPTLVQRAGKWLQRHPRVVAAVMLGLLLLSGGAGLSAALILREKEQLRLAQGRTKEALEGEERRGRLARRALDRMTTHVIDDWLARQPRLNAQQRAFLEATRADYEELAREMGTDPEVREGLARTQVRIAEIHALLGQQAEAERWFRRGLEGYRSIRADHPSAREPLQRLAVSQNSLGNLRNHAGQWEEAVAAYRQALTLAEELNRRFPNQVEDGNLLVVVRSHLSEALRNTGRLREAEQVCREGLARGSRLLGREPASEPLRQHQTQAWHTLGLVLASRGQIKEAEAACRKALALSRSLLRDAPTEQNYRRQLIGVLHHLGDVLRQRARFSEAESALREAVAGQRKLVEELPGVPWSRNTLSRVTGALGVLLHEAGRNREAEPLQREAVGLARQLAHGEPRSRAHQGNLANRLLNFGGLLLTLGRRWEAEAAYREGIDLRRELLRKAPNDSSNRLRLAQLYRSLGEARYSSGNRNGAQVMYQDACTLCLVLVREQPADIRRRAELAECYYDLARMRSAAGEVERSEAAYREAVAELWAVVGKAPDVVDYQTSLADTYNNLGNLLFRRGRLGEAAAASRAAWVIRKKLAARRPGALAPLMALADCQDNLARTLRQGRRPAEAEQIYGQSAALRERLASARPDDPELRFRLAAVLQNQAALLLGRGEPAQARRQVEKALAHQGHALRRAPNHPGYLSLWCLHHRLLVDALLRLGAHSDAGATAEKLVGLSPGRLDDAFVAHAFLARCALLVRRDAELPEHCRLEAARRYNERGREMLRACLRLRGNAPAELALVARSLCQRGEASLRDPDLAVELAREATRRADGVGAAWNALGLAHYREGDWEAARLALERAVRRSNGGDGRDWFLLAMTHWQAGRRGDARRCYARAVRRAQGGAEAGGELASLRAEARALLGIRP